MKLAISFCILILFSFTNGKYVYQANVYMPSQADIIYKSGTTRYEELVKECDAIGLNCAGFDTNGYLLNNVVNATQTDYVSIFVKTPGVVPAPLPNLWPLPQKYSFGTQTIQVATPFAFVPNVQDPILNDTLERYYKLVFVNGNSETIQGTLSSLSVIVSSTDHTLQLGTDESYTLSIDYDSAVLKANTVYGAMRGMETFSQLCEWDFDNSSYVIKHAPIAITDYPTFTHRGVLVDVTRHFIPIAQLKVVIDSLSYAKMNVLHLHASDTQSFPIESKTYPKLWEASWSKKERYTQAQLKDLVIYAQYRGVRVMPEFDGPGHMWAWGVGYPELLPVGYEENVQCANVCPINPCDVPIDPTNPAVYDMLSAFVGEMTGKAKRSGIFTEDLFHLGGDEVEYACWMQSPQIQQFMLQNNYSSYDQVYEYFVLKYEEIVQGYGRTFVHWEEVFDYFGTKLPASTIIHVWLDHATVKEVVEAGYRVIVSNGDVWYLDHLNTNWTAFYLNDPYEGVTAAQQPLVLGGQTCMWSEEVDISDQIRRIWPKSAAAAERLWSYSVANATDAVEVAIPRIQRFRCHLAERGIPVGPLYSPEPNQPGSCFDT